MTKPPANAKPMGLQNLYNTCYLPQPVLQGGTPVSSERGFDMHPLFKRLLEIPKCKEFYTSVLYKVADYLKKEQISNFSKSVGPWYRMIYNNFYQQDDQQITNADNPVVILGLNKTSGIKVSNDTVPTENFKVQKIENMCYVVEDNAYLGWTEYKDYYIDWYGSNNLKMFNYTGTIWNGENNEAQPANFISTTINNIMSQVKK